MLRCSMLSVLTMCVLMGGTGIVSVLIVSVLTMRTLIRCVLIVSSRIVSIEIVSVLMGGIPTIDRRA